MPPDKRAHFVRPALAFLAALAVLGLAGWQLWLDRQARQAESYDLALQRIRQHGLARMNAAVALLRSSAGLVAATGRMKAVDLRSFAASIDLAKSYPGVRAIAWSRRIAATERDALFRTLRSEGVPDFDIRFEPERDEFEPVVALAGEATGPVRLGDDMYREPAQRAALERSRDDDTSTLLPPGTQAGAPRWLWLCIPVYRDGRTAGTTAERRAQLLGYAFALLRPADLFAGALEQEAAAQIQYAVYDGSIETAESLLYQSPTTLPAAPGAVALRKTMAIGGRTWTLVLRHPPAIASLLHAPALLAMLAVGVLTSLLLAVAVRERARTREALSRYAAALRRARRALAPLRSAYNHALNGMRDSERRRTRLLARERALRAQAEAANRAKDEFLATLSHELRAPLNAILGWTQTLLDGRTTKSSLLRALVQIEESANIQARLIDDLLNVSDIVAGRLRLDVQPLRLSTAIGAAVDSLRPAIDAKGIRLLSSYAEDADCIRGDPVRLQQVAWNLLSNAVKFTPRGGEIRLTLQKIGLEVEIAVVDNGEGISARFLPDVFKRFRQADASSKRRHGGLGLGLAIVRHLVELHGGTVTAASAGIGRGARFTVRLPIAAPTPSPPAAPAAAAPLALPARVDTPRPRLDGLRILSVDDDRNTREMLQESLQRAGAAVLSVSTAAEALAVLPSFRPDVLVSDIGLPDQDGYEMLRQLRTRPAAQGGATPAIALTGYARPQDQQASAEAGYQAFTPKPVHLDELFALILRLAPPPHSRA